MRAAVRQLLRGHEPFPAIVVDGAWNLIEANSGLAWFTESVAPDLRAPPANALRFCLHPQGMAPRIVNLGEYRAHILGRLRRHVVHDAAPELARLYDELRAYPCDQPEPDIELPGPSAIFVPLRIRRGSRELAFFSTIATFGTPLDITVAELVIESFFPANPERATILGAGPPVSGTV
ncbi:MAG TPA: hypothetical protein VNL35_22365 [Chloroflexota bacterium]|nr:hypothetical protein [Chloroflexota bacterium]